MKVTVNFSTPAGGMAPYLTLACLALAITAGIASVAMFLSARELHVNNLELREQLAHYRSREVVVPEKLLPREKLAALGKQVSALNSITGTRGRALPLLLATLEKVMPDGVWLANLQYRPREGETELLVEADRTELLTDFMDRLEQSGSFARVLLTRQAPRSDGAQRTIQFEIQLQEQP